MKKIICKNKAFLNWNPETLENVVEKSQECGSSTFIQALELHYLGALESKSGRAEIAATQVFKCTECGAQLDVKPYI